MTEHPPGLHRTHDADVQGARHVRLASTKADAIRAIYRAVDAPAWAAPNLDGLADVLRDLSWLPPGPVVLTWPGAGDAVVDVVRRVATESANTSRPLTVYLIDP